MTGVTTCSGTVRRCLLAALLLACATAGGARADGDPASDVLVSQALFLPQDAATTPQQQAQLSTLLAHAAAAGYRVRVAVIGSRADLGSVTALWRQPRSYAQFLGQELALTYKGTLLVVMPNGYGVHDAAPGPGRDVAALRGLHSPGAALAPAALSAVVRLAATAGHRLSVPAATASSGSASLGPVSWLALAIGCALIAVAWTWSLGARPLRGAPRTEH